MFIIKKNQLSLHENHSKEFTLDGTDITIKFRPASNPNFRKVNNLIAQYKEKAQENQAILDKNAIKNLDADSLDEYEAILYAIGEYLIEDWNIVIDDEGKQEKLTPSGDNLMALIGGVSEPNLLVEWCFECMGKISQEIQEQAIELKKKPSKDGSGNKATKT